MQQYVDLVKRILAEGEERHDRTGVGTKAVFSHDLKFDLRESFPLVTVKKTLWRSAFIEMLWFIRGEPNIKFLKDHGVSIWDEWADEAGNLGPVYGVQWREWPGKIHAVPLRELVDTALTTPSEKFDYAKYENYVGERSSGSPEYETMSLYQERVDQLSELIVSLKTNPTGRRHMVTAWNPGFIKEMGLPPCHYLFQCYVSNDGFLDLKWSQRSVDVMLGLPFNIAQYALLTHMIAMVCGYRPRYLMATLGDTHVYSNHIDAVEKIITHAPKPATAQLVINRTVDDINAFTFDDFDVINYDSHPFIKLPVAV